MKPKHTGAARKPHQPETPRIAFLKRFGRVYAACALAAFAPEFMTLMLRLAHGGVHEDARQFISLMLYLIWPFVCIGIASYVVHSQAHTERQARAAGTTAAVLCVIRMRALRVPLPAPRRGMP